VVCVQCVVAALCCFAAVPWLPFSFLDKPLNRVVVVDLGLEQRLSPTGISHESLESRNRKSHDHYCEN
jgi:hypothetical protein